MWINGYENTQFIDWAAEQPVAEPFPESLWRIDPAYYDGYPFIPLFPDFLELRIPVTKRNGNICVYDIGTPKTKFSGNGLAILQPVSCTSTEEENGAYYVNLTHPFDPEGRWQYLQQYNILKVNGQLFTIRSVDTRQTGEKSGTVSIYAEHIWYQQADGWVFPDEYIVGTSGQRALWGIKTQTYYHAGEHDTIYDFQGYSDIRFPPEKYWVQQLNDGTTPIDLMVGADGFIAKFGGELYRDNFHFSINERREGARERAFDIRIGKNVKGVRRIVDTSDFASYFRIYDAWGGWWACCWVLDETLARQFPHQTVRSVNAERPYNADAEDFDYDYYFNNILVKEGEAWFKSHCKPVVGYEIDFEDVRGDPEFSIIANETLRVGDSGTLYDELLGGMLTLRITAVERDELRDKVTRAVIGEQLSFTRPPAPPAVMGLELENLGGEEWVQDADGVFCYDADGVKIIVEVGT